MDLLPVRFSIKTLFVLTLMIGICCWFLQPFSPKIQFHLDGSDFSSLPYSDASPNRVKIKFTNQGISRVYYPGTPSKDQLVSSFDLVHDGQAVLQSNPHWLKLDSYNRYVKRSELEAGESAFIEFDLPRSFIGFSIQFEVSDWRGRKAIVNSKYIRNDGLSPNL